jgi:DNA-3-methyladenine glycosylase II
MSVSGKMKAALTERYGGMLTVDGETYTAFPSPDRLAQATSYEIAETIGHGAKAVLIQGAAKAFVRVDDHWLRDAPYGEVEAWLKSIKGIGEWSAAFILLRALGRAERLPVKERRTLDAAAKVYGLFSIDDAELYRIGARYGKYIGLWAHYMRAAV